MTTHWTVLVLIFTRPRLPLMRELSATLIEGLSFWSRRLKNRITTNAEPHPPAYAILHSILLRSVWQNLNQCRAFVILQVKNLTSIQSVFYTLPLCKYSLFLSVLGYSVRCRPALQPKPPLHSRNPLYNCRWLFAFEILPGNFLKKSYHSFRSQGVIFFLKVFARGIFALLYSFIFSLPPSKQMFWHLPQQRGFL